MKYGTPLEGIPIELIRPPGRSTTRGSGLPARSSRVMVLVTKAPSRLKSITLSRPSANVPEAGITGLASVRPPTRTRKVDHGSASIMSNTGPSQHTRR